MKKKLLIWGASGHAKVVTDILALQQQHQIVAYVDDTAEAPDMFNAIKVLRSRKAVLDYQQKHKRVCSMFIAVGNCRARLLLAQTSKKMGF